MTTQSYSDIKNSALTEVLAPTLDTISSPKISSITYVGNDTAASIDGNQIITLNGSGFKSGAVVYINNSPVGSTSIVDSQTITFISPSKTTGSYTLYMINSDGGTAIYYPGIQYSGTPAWTTSAGTLGSIYETQSFSYTLSATSDSTVHYELASGSTLVPGGSLDSVSGVISGTATSVSSSTTYSFAVDAIDEESQDTRRSFNVVVNPDVITWNSPTNGQSFSGIIGDSVSISLNASSVLGNSITYSGTLPAGLTLSGSTISGSYTTEESATFTITATSNNTNKSSSVSLNWQVISAPPAGQTEFTTPGTYSWTAPAGVTSVSAVAVGGGGSGGQGNVATGGGGGGLGWKNNIQVTPGQSYTVVVGFGGFTAGSSGGNSYFINTSTVVGYGGAGGYVSGQSSGGGSGGSYVGTGGGTGGEGGGCQNYQSSSDLTPECGGGGGAGGYSGAGGKGAGYWNTLNGSSGNGGGGGGGGSPSSYGGGKGGGGVGIYGQGASGSGGNGAYRGQGGSGGNPSTNMTDNLMEGGSFGGGGGGSWRGGEYGYGSGGAVRIIWGTGRAYPSTNTANV